MKDWLLFQVTVDVNAKWYSHLLALTLILAQFAFLVFLAALAVRLAWSL